MKQLANLWTVRGQQEGGRIYQQLQLQLPFSGQNISQTPATSITAGFIIQYNITSQHIYCYYHSLHNAEKH